MLCIGIAGCRRLLSGKSRGATRKERKVVGDESVMLARALVEAESRDSRRLKTKIKWMG